MIIGKGMIAKAMSPYFENGLDIIIIAAGVSNSNETREKEFLREKNLILKYVKSNFHIVYFSSCSLINEKNFEIPYYDHKRNMEELILSMASKYTIIRLPQVVGFTENKNTLINFLIDRIRANRELTIWSNAKRYVVDVEDVAFFFNEAFKMDKFINRIINFSSPYRYDVLEIVDEIFELLDVQVQVNLIDKSDYYDLDLQEIVEFNRELSCPIIFERSYLKDRLKKYFFLSRL